MPVPTFEVRVIGGVGPKSLRDFGIVACGHERDQTVLYGTGDETALFGLLSHLRELGLEVIEVRQPPAMLRDRATVERASWWCGSDDAQPPPQGN